MTEACRARRKARCRPGKATTTRRWQLRRRTCLSPTACHSSDSSSTGVCSTSRGPTGTSSRSSDSTSTSTGPTNGRSVWGWTPLWIQEFRFPRIYTDFFFFSSSQLGVLAFQAAQQPQQGLCPLAVVGTDFLYCTQDSGTARVLSRQRLVYSPAQRPPAASRGRLAIQRPSNGAFFTILITNITIKLQWPLIYILILRT